jgi:hypothetical protein
MDADGDGRKPRATAAQIIEEMRRQAAEEQARAQASGNGGGGYGGGGGEFMLFGEVMVRQVDRRVELLRRATKLDPEAAERGVGAEEAEQELERAS